MSTQKYIEVERNYTFFLSYKMNFAFTVMEGPTLFCCEKIPPEINLHKFNYEDSINNLLRTNCNFFF